MFCTKYKSNAYALKILTSYVLLNCKHAYTHRYIENIFFQYLGKWYEVERYFALFEFGGKCVTANYTLSENGSVKIVNKQISSL